MSVVDRVNKTVLIIIALLLLAAGGLGLAAGYGAFGDDVSGDPVLLPAIDEFLNRSAVWLWPLVGPVALLLAWLGYRWLRAQIPVPTSATDVKLPSSSAGYTRLQASALTDALSTDIEKARGVRSARSRIDGASRPAEIDIAVEVAQGAAVDDVRRHIDRYALPRLQQALEKDRAEVRVLVKVGKPAGRQLQ